MAYTITFENYDGTVLQTGEVEEGATPAYTGATPTRPSTAELSYSFTGWSPSIVAVTQDAIYTAQYESGVTAIVVAADGSMGEDDKRQIFQVFNDSSIDSMPTNAAIGSLAYLPDMSKVWILDNSKMWVETTTAALVLAAII